MRWLILCCIGLACYQFFKGPEADRTTLPQMTLQYAPGSAEYVPGEPALIEFWATWCPPCRQSVPHLNDLLDKCADIDLQVIGVTDDDLASIEEFRRRTPIRYSVGMDAPGLLSRHFGVKGIPYAILVDGSGKVKWSGHPMEVDERFIRDALP